MLGGKVPDPPKDDPETAEPVTKLHICSIEVLWQDPKERSGIYRFRRLNICAIIEKPSDLIEGSCDDRESRYNLRAI
jgi:hypothetical protein